MDVLSRAFFLEQSCLCKDSQMLGAGGCVEVKKLSDKPGVELSSLVRQEENYSESGFMTERPKACTKLFDF